MLRQNRPVSRSNFLFVACLVVIIGKSKVNIILIIKKKIRIKKYVESI